MGKCCKKKSSCCIIVGPTGARGPTGSIGPTGGITGIINIGDGVPLLTGPIGGNYELRTLQQDCSTAVRQDIPIDGDVLLSTSEYQTQLAHGDPQSTLNVYVSSTGNDANTGTQVSPFLTLNRAFQEIRCCGWDDSAAVIVDAAGGNYTLPSGELSLNAGTRGAQRTPLRLMGSGRTQVGAGTVLTAVARPGSNLIEFTSGDYAFSAADVGRMVRFTSGPLSAVTNPFLPGGTTAVDVAIASFVNPSVIIPYNAGTLPNPGDSFVIETFDTTLSLTGLARIRADANAIAFEEFNLVVSPDPLAAIPTGGLLIVNTEIATYGVNISLASSLILFLINHDAGWISGLVEDNLNSGFLPTTRSMFVDTRIPSAYLSIGLDNNPRLWGNAVFLGSSTNLVTFSYSGVINDSYFSQMPTITPQFNGNLNLSNVELESFPSNGILVGEGSVVLANVAILSPGTAGTAHGINANSSGRVTLGGLFGGQTLITNASGNAIYAHNGSQVYISGTPTFTGSVGDHIVVESNAQVTNITALVLNGSGNNGMTVSDSGRFVSFFFGNSLTTNGNANRGLVVIRGGFVQISGTLTSTGNLVNVEVLFGSQLTVGSTCTLTGATTGDNMFVDSSFVTMGNLDVSGSLGGHGLEASNSKIVLNGFFSSPLTANSNALSGVRLDRSSLSCDGGLASNTNSNGTHGMDIYSSSYDDLSGLISGSNGGSGINSGFNSAIIIATFTAITNTGFGALINNSRFTSNSGGTITGNLGGNGVAGSRVSNIVMNGHDINGNAASGILIDQASSAQLTAITTTGAPNTGYGVEVRHGSKVTTTMPGMTVTGTLGDALVGTNAVATWAAIATAAPVIATDLFNVATENCSLTP
jgi:hypothetical protein